MGNEEWKGAGLYPWDWELSLFFRAFTLSGLVPIPSTVASGT